VTAPALAIQQNGLLQVSGDNYNTYAQTCNIVTDLRGFIGVSGVQVYMRGTSAIGDGGQGWFYWNASGVAPDDGGITTIVPNGAATGEWTRLPDTTAITLYNTITPQGRLTLVSGTPVQIADQVNKTAIFYTPYIGSMLPILSGTNFIAGNFSELTLTLNTSAHLSGNLYDIFAFLNAGVRTLGTGPAWSTATSRGTGAGTTQVSALQGLQTNANTITLKNGTNTFAGIGVGQAVLLGTFYATANGQTGAAFKPTAAAGGSNNIIGISNLYNRIKQPAICRDSNTSWTYATANWRQMDNSASNRINVVDCLGISPAKAHLQVSLSPGTAGNSFAIGVNLNSASATPNIFSITIQPTGSNYIPASSDESFYPSLGFNYYQAMEESDGSTATINPGPTHALIVDVEY
jgi:hypothetical protein